MFTKVKVDWVVVEDVEGVLLEVRLLASCLDDWVCREYLGQDSQEFLYRVWRPRDTCLTGCSLLSSPGPWGLCEKCYIWTRYLECQTWRIPLDSVRCHSHTPSWRCPPRSSPGDGGHLPYRPHLTSCATVSGGLGDQRSPGVTLHLVLNDLGTWTYLTGILSCLMLRGLCTQHVFLWWCFQV